MSARGALPQPAGLGRHLGVTDAVVIGLGSMIGAGVFTALAPAAAAAGGWFLLGLVLAALVAYCNATSSAQLAAQYPTSGGTYVYGRERLGPWPGFLAGWGFVVGKTASAAAMSLTFATYLAPAPWDRVLAVAAIWALVGVTLRGITRTARLTRIIVGIVVAILAVLVVTSLLGTETGRLAEAIVGGPAGSSVWEQAHGVLQSGGLMFFAFAGFARIATMGEEVIDPTRTIPRAITLALGLAVLVYLAVALGLIGVLGVAGIAATPTPLAAAAAASGMAWLEVLVRIGAALAALGALLALLAGLGRTSLAMAREGDLPRTFAVIEPVHKVPARAELAVGCVVTVLVLLGDLREVIGFSSFGVLLYYTVANLAAWTQVGPHRRYPRALQVLGTVACLVLVVALPWPSILVGVVVLGVGVAYRALRLTPSPGGGG